jgi:hypothetical protein
MKNLDQALKLAIRHFWTTRNAQAEKQGAKTGQRDAGSRTAVTGGKHLDGFISLCRNLLIEAGLPEVDVFWRNQLELPGYFRAEKCWDLLAVLNDIFQLPLPGTTGRSRRCLTRWRLGSDAEK